MSTNEERITALGRGFENEQEWRREIPARLDRVESNQRWLSGLTVTMLIAHIAIIASNRVG